MKRAAAVVACALACATWPAVGRARRPAARRGDRASAAPAAAIDPDRAREQARDVLAERRFQPNGCRRRCAGSRERIGDALRRGGGPLESAYDWVAGWFPGGPPLLITLLAATILAGQPRRSSRAASPAAAQARAPARARAGRRRGAPPERGAACAGRPTTPSARGDLDAALRLRFRAGLVELHARELIELRPALTNHELLRAVPSPTLADLVDGFEAVAYGGREAAAERRRPRPRRLAARRSRRRARDEPRAPLLPRTTAARVVAGVVAFLVALNLVALVISFLRPEPSGADGLGVRDAAARRGRLRRAAAPRRPSGRLLREPLAEARLDPRDDARRARRAAAGRRASGPRSARFVRAGGRLVAGGPLAGRGIVPRAPRWVPAGPRARAAERRRARDERPAQRRERRRGRLQPRWAARCPRWATRRRCSPWPAPAAAARCCSPTPRRCRTACSRGPTTPRSALALAGPARRPVDVRRVRPRLRPRHRPGGDPAALALRARLRRARRRCVWLLSRARRLGPPELTGETPTPRPPRARRGARAGPAPRARRRRRARAGAGGGARAGHPARRAGARRARRGGARRRAAARLRGG